jgi:hypothetical protein
MFVARSVKSWNASPRAIAGVCGPPLKSTYSAAE